MPSWILAIDFGTSYTVAAARVEGRSPEIVEIAGERRMPSVVMVDPQGDVFVGRTAEDLSVTHPGSTLRALKNRLGDQTPAILGGRPHQVVNLVAALLREVFEHVVEQMGSAPAEVRLTHPATWNQPRVNRLVEAAAKAGLPSPLMVPEPVAAALSYAADVGIDNGRAIVVYDLGGGTFDSAVVTARNGGFTVVGRPGGDQHIGGELFDELIVNHIGGLLEPDAWEAIQIGDDPLWRQVGAALRNEARKAKEALSSHPYVTVLVPLPAGLRQVRLTRDEFEDMVRPYVAETVSTLQRCVAEAGVGVEELAGISLVGGSSRSPIVEEMVRAAFPMVPLSRRGDPKATVAAGATLADRPSTSTPGLWKSPVTQEASPGTAQQRVRLAPPPISEPSQPMDPISGVPSLRAPDPVPPRPPVGTTPMPPDPAGVPTVVTAEPARASRRKMAVLVGFAAVAVIALVVFVVTRSNGGDSIETSATNGPLVTNPADTVQSATTESDVTDSSSLGTTAPTAVTTVATTAASTQPTTGVTTADTSDGGEIAPPLGSKIETLDGHKADILSVEFSPDSSLLVTASLDGLAFVWDVASGQQVAVLAGHTDEVYSAVFSPDGSRIATTGADRTVRVWDTANGDQLAVFTGHTDTVYQVRFSPDGGSLLSASADGTARLWDIATQTQTAIYTGATESLYFAEFNPAGDLIVGGGQDDNVLLWRVADPGNPLVLAGHTGDVQIGSFSPDGTILLTGADDARIRVWSADDGALIYDLGDIEGGVTSAMFSHDGTLLIASGHDNTAALWDVASGQLMGDLAGHTATVFSAVFSPEDSLVVTASEDGTARIWQLQQPPPPGVTVAVLDNDGASVPTAVFSPDGKWIATGNSAGHGIIWAA